MHVIFAFSLAFYVSVQLLLGATQNSDVSLGAGSWTRVGSGLVNWVGLGQSRALR